MKTTLELPDAIYRQIKARAALEGKTVRAFFLEAVRDKLAGKGVHRRGETGWRAVFGNAPQSAVAELQTRLDGEFSRIDPDDWR